MNPHHPFCFRLFLTTVLAGSCFIFVSAEKLHAQTPNSAVHTAPHVADPAMGTQPPTPAPNASKGDPALAQQLSQLQARVAQLEAALAKGTAPTAAPPVAVPPVAAPPAPAMAGMSAGAAPAGGANGMMAMMDKMMGMMDKMMPPAGGAPMSSGGMAAPAAGMNNMSGGMSGGAGSMTQSSVPGVPGASHLYHIGATGFFLDHPQHITLTMEQQAGLNKAKERALLAKSAADRAVEQAEQALWLLTAADQPDATQIEAKIREIEKLRGDGRLAFVRAVGDASKLLTEEQRKSLAGFAPPAPTPTPTNSMTPPAAAMPAGGMKKDM